MADHLFFFSSFFSSLARWSWSGGGSDDGGDFAEVDAALEIDVTVNSPVSAPRVPDVPDVGALDDTESGGLDGMIDLVTTTTENSSGVILPRRGVDTDGDGSGVGDVIQHLGVLGGGGLGDPLPRIDGGDNFGFSEFASALDCLVRIVNFGFHATGADDILERVVRIAAAAALIDSASVAVNNLLGSERLDSISSESPGRLDRFGGGKGPARAALFLVLDGGDDSGFVDAPVPLGGVSKRSFGEGHFGKSVRECEGEILGFEFFGSEVHEFGDAKDRGSVFRVHHLDAFEVDGEDTNAVESLGGRSVLLVEFGLEGVELLEDFDVGVGHSGQRDGGEAEGDKEENKE